MLQTSKHGNKQSLTGKALLSS